MATPMFRFLSEIVQAIFWWIVAVVATVTFPLWIIPVAVVIRYRDAKTLKQINSTHTNMPTCSSKKIDARSKAVFEAAPADIQLFSNSGFGRVADIEDGNRYVHVKVGNGADARYVMYRVIEAEESGDRAKVITLRKSAPTPAGHVTESLEADEWAD